MQPLSPREQLFVTEYLINPIAKHAAIKAGYTPSHADMTGVKLLRKPNVAAAITAAQAARNIQCNIKAEQVIEELARIGFADITQYFDEQGKLKPMSEWPHNAGKMIASVKTQTIKKKGDKAPEVTITELKLWDKIGALDKLAKHFGLLMEHKPETPQEQVKKMTDEELDEFLAEALRMGALNLKVVSK